MILTVNDIRGCVRTLGCSINAPEALLTVPSKPTPDGVPYIEVKGNSYHYVISERGFEFSRKETDDIKLLLYWVFKSITSEMATQYEILNRIQGQDFRRLKFSYQRSLLKAVSESWEAIFLKEVSELLMKSPYLDTK